MRELWNLDDALVAQRCRGQDHLQRLRTLLQASQQPPARHDENGCDQAEGEIRREEDGCFVFFFILFGQEQCGGDNNAQGELCAGTAATAAHTLEQWRHDEQWCDFREWCANAHPTIL